MTDRLPVSFSEARTAASESFMAAFGALSCGVLVLDPAQHVCHVNPELIRMTGGHAAQWPGHSIRAIAQGTLAARLLGPDEAIPALDRSAHLELPAGNGGTIPVTAIARRGPRSTLYCSHVVITIVDCSDTHPEIDAFRERTRIMTELSDTVLEQALRLNKENEWLEQRVRERTAQVYEAHRETIFMLAVACEARDADTGAHVRRVQNWVERLALAMGLSESQAMDIGLAAILHDVGKVTIPDRILLKRGRLNADERHEIQQHTLRGEMLLGDKPHFETARQIARHHHENWDGSGYPDGLAREAIPLAARLVRAVDVFDALSHPRPYKDAWTIDAALEALQAGAGKQFDPQVATRLIELIEASRATIEQD